MTVMIRTVHGNSRIVWPGIMISVIRTPQPLANPHVAEINQPCVIATPSPMQEHSTRHFIHRMYVMPVYPSVSGL